VTRINIAPLRDLDLFEQGLQNIIDRFPGPWNWNWHFVPPVDMYEDATNLYLDVELPGMQKEDVKITIHKGVLTLKGERRLAEEDRSRTMLRRERSNGSFTRSLALPVEVDVNKVDATFSNGVLHVSMSKANPKDIERSIEIR